MHSIEKEFLSHINTHKGILHKVSRMYMDDIKDREDLFQEIILQLWKSYAGFKKESLFSTWMYRIAINTALTFLKKEKRRPDNIVLHPQMDIKDESNAPVKERQLEIFYKAVQFLSPVEKALVFYFMEGRSNKETAVNLGISEVNARVKLSRTKEKLQQLIKQQGYEF